MTRRILGTALAVALAACASSNASREEVASLSADEGVVIGSLLVTAEKAGEGEDSNWAFLQGRTAGDASYTVSVYLVNFLYRLLGPGFPSYDARVTPEKELVFVTRLSGGEYHFGELLREGFGNLALDLTLVL